MKPREIVERMMQNDRFSQWLGIRVNSVEPGRCELSMVIREEMLNGFRIAHGGISYSVADSALAFASNSGGVQSLSIETSISHVQKLNEGDILHASAECVSENEKLGYYDVNVWTDDHKKPVAIFKGVVYKTSRRWEEA